MKKKEIVQDHGALISDIETQLVRDKIENASIKEIILHLKQTHQLYRNYFIPGVEQLFTHLIKSNPDQPAVVILFNLFQKFSLSLDVHMKLEEEHIFSKCERYFEDGQTNAFNVFEGHQKEEPYVTEIINFLSQTPFKNRLVHHQLISLMHAFNRNLQEHAWIEEDILTKKIQAKITLKLNKSLNT
ncbi:MAG: hypothetical protein ACPGU5_08925 [Lishizhenia sp.]